MTERALLDTLPEGARVLIVRSSAIGDMVMCTPLAQALRAARPDLHIAWLSEDIYRDVLDGVDAIDEVIAWPRRHWRSLWKQRRFAALFGAVRELREVLLERDFDLAIDAQGLLRSRLLCRLSGARVRVGFASREPGGFLLHRLVDKGGDAAEISSEYRHLARALGAAPPFPSPPFGIADAARGEAQRVLGARGVSGPFVALCPFTTRPQKHWIDAHWQPMRAQLATGLGWPVVVLGGPADAQRAQQLGLDDCVDLVGQTSLSVAAAIIARAGVVVGVDTGLTHVGIATGRPTLALFGSTRPYTRTGYPRVEVMYRDLDCAPCKRRPTCAGRFDCMRELMPDAVAAVATRLATA